MRAAASTAPMTRLTSTTAPTAAAYPTQALPTSRLMISCAKARCRAPRCPLLHVLRNLVQRGRHEQVFGGDSAPGEPLLVAVVAERLQVVAVRLEAVRPGVVAEHRLLLLEQL